MCVEVRRTEFWLYISCYEYVILFMYLVYMISVCVLNYTFGNSQYSSLLFSRCSSATSLHPEKSSEAVCRTKASQWSENVKSPALTVGVCVNYNKKFLMMFTQCRFLNQCSDGIRTKSLRFSFMNWLVTVCLRIQYALFYGIFLTSEKI